MEYPRIEVIYTNRFGIGLRHEFTVTDITGAIRISMLQELYVGKV